MTELNFVLRLSADGKSATAEVRSVTNVVKEAKAEAEGLAVKGREAAGGVGVLGGAAGGACGVHPNLRVRASWSGSE